MKRALLIRKIYKILAWFVLVYGAVGMLFYSFSLFFYSAKTPFVPELGFNSFNFSALFFMNILFALLYAGIFADGILLLKRNPYAINAYFFLIFIYYSVNVWVTGEIDVVFLVIELVLGLVLYRLQKKINRS